MSTPHSTSHRPVCARPLLSQILLLILLVGLCLTSSLARAGEPQHAWTRFRGENGAGSIPHCNVPLPWKAEDVAWEIDLPGKGNGSPIYYGDRIFLMSAHPDTAERYLLGIDLATGKTVWKKSEPSQPHILHTRSSYASSTPCANERAVYFAWAAPDNLTLAAFTHDGDEIWRRNLGSFASQHGHGASPALFGDTLVLFNSQAGAELPPGVEPGQSRVMAFNAATGEDLWETPNVTTQTCYGVPTYFKDESGKDALLLASTGDGIFALELDTGKPLWNTQVFSKRCVSCPVIVGDLAIGTEGSGGGGNILFGVELSGKHELKLKVDRSAPYVPTPVVKGELVFLWGDKGIVTCVHAASGRIEWSKRIGGNVSTSPVIAGDKLIGISEDGTVTILQASADFKELGNIKLDQTTRATPALAEDFILIRTDSRLIRIGKTR